MHILSFNLSSSVLAHRKICLWIKKSNSAKIRALRTFHSIKAEKKNAEQEREICDRITNICKKKNCCFVAVVMIISWERKMKKFIWGNRETKNVRANQQSSDRTNVCQKIERRKRRQDWSFVFTLLNGPHSIHYTIFKWRPSVFFSKQKKKNYVLCSQFGFIYLMT